MLDEFVLLIISLCLVVLYYFRFINTRASRLLAALPGPKPWPLIGNYNLLIDDFKYKPQMMYRLLNQLSKQYANEGIFKLQLGLKTLVVLISPDYAEQLTREINFFKKGPEADSIRPFAGDGIFNSEGAKWKFHRKVSNSALSLSKLHEFIPMFNANSRKVVEELRKCSNIDNAYLYFGRMTLDNVLESTMGVKFDVLSKPEHPVLLAAVEIKRLIGERIFNPLLRYDFIYNLTSNCSKYWAVSSTMRMFAGQVFDVRRAEFVKGEGTVSEREEHDGEVLKRKTRSLLDELLKTHFELQNSMTMSKTDVIDTALTFILAAEDTTASAISYTLLWLVKFPHIAQRLQQELDDFLNHGEDITKEHLSRLVYLDSVIRESMRLRPPVGTSLRVLEKDMQFGKYIVPEGTSITVYFQGIHQRVDVYGKDVDEFRPERWLAGDDRLKSKFVWLPFSCGPRKCPGDVYAMMSLKIIIGHLMKNFDVKLQCEEPEFKIHLLVLPTKPISFRFIPRLEKFQ